MVTRGGSQTHHLANSLPCSDQLSYHVCIHVRVCVCVGGGTEHKHGSSLYYPTHTHIDTYNVHVLYSCQLHTYSMHPPMYSLPLPPPPLSPPTHTHTQRESLPVVVIVHVTQQPPAEATIFWDNAFAEAVSHTDMYII